MMHRSMLPRGRLGPLLLYDRSVSFFLSSRQVGQYHARGPPAKTVPHFLQVRARNVLFLWSFAQAGQLMAPGSPSNSTPQCLQILFMGSRDADIVAVVQGFQCGRITAHIGEILFILGHLIAKHNIFGFFSVLLVYNKQCVLAFVVTSCDCCDFCDLVSVHVIHCHL